MKKITLFSVCLFFTLTNLSAQKKQTNVKNNPSKSSTTVTATSKEIKADTESAPQVEPVKNETKKTETNLSLSQDNPSLNNSGSDRGSMSFEEVYEMYKEKIELIENDIAQKKMGIQKDATLSKEDKQKKIDEYNAYRAQSLKNIFGDKNFVNYEQTIKH